MKSPVLFVGHGSPMNAITDNPYKEEWIRLGEAYRPKAILVISAHWYAKGTMMHPDEEPKQIYDMYGFPQELYEVKYQPQGSLALANRVKLLLGDDMVYNNNWGIDHGTWSVLKWMYPKADIPICQLSIDADASGQDYYEIGEKLAPLRDEDILIIGSGNIVHNLRMVDWNQPKGFDWAKRFDGLVKEHILKRKVDPLIDFKNLPDSKLAIPTKDHYAPLLYVLGAAGQDRARIFNEACELGSLSMTSYLFEAGLDV